MGVFTLSTQIAQIFANKIYKVYTTATPSLQTRGRSESENLQKVSKKQKNTTEKFELLANDEKIRLKKLNCQQTTNN